MKAILKTVGKPRGMVLLLLGAITIAVPRSAHAQDQVYVKESDGPRFTSALKDVWLRTAQGLAQPITVRAGLAKIRLSHDSTSTSIGWKGSEHEYRKFVHIELSRLSPSLRPAKLEATYTVKEGETEKVESETIPIPGTREFSESKVIFVDLTGFRDVTGTRVSSSSLGTFTTLHTKRRNYIGEITAVEVKVTGRHGAVLFYGGWPDAPRSPAKALTGSRVFTNSKGVTIEAEVISVGGSVVNLRRKGRIYTVPIERLSLQDQAFLGKLQASAGP